MNLTFEAPLWLAALPLLWFYCLWLHRRAAGPDRWVAVVESPLREALMRQRPGRRAEPAPAVPGVLGLSSAVLALAGPVWGEHHPLHLAPGLLVITTLLGALAFRRGWLTPPGTPRRR